MRWDNRDHLEEGVPVWHATVGEHALPLPAFQAAVESFHQHFMRAMAERVAEARANWPFPDVAIDLDRLAAEQQQRTRWLQEALDRARDGEQDDWDQIAAAMQFIDAQLGSEATP